MVSLSSLFLNESLPKPWQLAIRVEDKKYLYKKKVGRIGGTKRRTDVSRGSSIDAEMAAIQSNNAFRQDAATGAR